MARSTGKAKPPPSGHDTRVIRGEGRDQRRGWNPDGDVPENILDAYNRTQPPQLNARQVWPKQKGIRIQWTIDRASNDDINKEIPGLLNDNMRTGRYCEGPDATVHGVSWKDHVKEVRDALVELHCEQYSSSFCLEAMLGVLGQGIESAVYMMRDLIHITSKPGEAWLNGDDIKSSDPRFSADTVMVDVELPTREATLRIRDAIYGRRFIASVVHVATPEHWMGVVFDRMDGILYFMDPLVNGRQGRAVQVLHAWRQLGANLGFHGHISAVLLPITDQPNGWSCGFLVLAMLQRMLRDLTGAKMPELVIEHGDSADSAATGNVLAPVLRTPDWTFGAADPETGFSRAVGLLTAIMCNELGIKDFQCLRAPANGFVRHDRFLTMIGQTPEPMQFVLESDDGWEVGEGVFPAVNGPDRVQYAHGLGRRDQKKAPPGFPRCDYTRAQLQRTTGFGDRDKRMRCGQVTSRGRQKQNMVSVKLPG